VNATAEVLIEPFTEGELGPHVQNAIESLEAAGFEVAVGPFGNQITGNHHAVVSAIGHAITSAIDSGAVRVTVTVEINP
jgi:uncharacterized protein YqgV (UPF0045/DUF77 family)